MVIQSNADGYSIPPMIDCHYEIRYDELVSRARGLTPIGTRLIVEKFDLEPESIGDSVTVSYGATVLTLKTEACKSSADCSHSWQSTSLEFFQDLSSL